MKNNIIELTKENDIEGVRKFIADGGDINMQDEDGQTALMLAIFHEKKEIAKLLIEGIEKLDLGTEELDLKDNQGRTALMYANYTITKLLIKAGANKNIKDNSGKTALDYAKEENNIKIIELLTPKK